MPVQIDKERAVEQVKLMFDKFRRPLRIVPGDYAYGYYLKTLNLPKLRPKAYGPYPVRGVDYRPFTRDPVGVTLNIGTSEEPCDKWFARGRVHPLSYVHRDINWAALARAANDLGGHSQGFLSEFDRAIDDTAITQGRCRRIHLPGLQDPDDCRIQSATLRRYLEEPRTRRLYQVQ